MYKNQLIRANEATRRIEKYFQETSQRIFLKQKEIKYTARHWEEQSFNCCNPLTGFLLTPILLKCNKMFNPSPLTTTVANLLCGQ